MLYSRTCKVEIREWKTNTKKITTSQKSLIILDEYIIFGLVQGGDICRQTEQLVILVTEGDSGADTWEEDDTDLLNCKWQLQPQWGTRGQLL